MSFWTKKLYGGFMLGWSKKLEYILKITNIKNKPIKPKISSSKNNKREKQWFSLKKITKRHLGNLHHLKYIPWQKQMLYLESLYSILHFDGSKNSEYLCKSRFFNKNRLNRIFPPSWILFQQTQRIFVDARCYKQNAKKFFEIRWKLAIWQQN
jgi:hypothetical protein